MPAVWINSKIRVYAKTIREKQESQDLPDHIPGLDIADALKRLGGNRKLLKKLLINFADDYSEEPQTIRNALDRGEMEYIRRTAHTIKGVAGNLGADKLSEVAAELEAASVNGSPDDDILNDFETALNLTMASAITLKVAPPEASADVSDAETPLAVDREKLSSLLFELNECLESGQFKAARSAENLKKLLPGAVFREPLQRLAKHIDNYDFDEARKPVAEIAGLLDIVLERVKI